MTHDTATLRELAHRIHDGLEVTLLWDPESNEVVLDLVDDRNDSSFSRVVPPGSALDAFTHPYVYAPAWIDLGSDAVREAAVTES